jgi:hypothetical protein
LESEVITRGAQRNVAQRNPGKGSSRNRLRPPIGHALAREITDAAALPPPRFSYIANKPNFFGYLTRVKPSIPDYLFEFLSRPQIGFAWVRILQKLASNWLWESDDFQTE